MGDLTKNFNRSEYACKCCGKFKANPILINKLQLFREHICDGKKPVIIYSAYRCPKNNAACGGAKESYHMQGMAADIHVDGVTFADMVWRAKQEGFNAIGIYPEQGFVHVDVRTSPVCWVKHDGKDYQYMSYEQLMNRAEMKQVLK